MEGRESLREIENLRFRFQMNNRLRLECLAAVRARPDLGRARGRRAVFAGLDQFPVRVSRRRRDRAVLYRDRTRHRRT